MKSFKDAGHLFRVAAVFLAGLILFLMVRAVLVPHSFGRYGHYRADAIGEIAALPVHYAGHQVCESCHTDVAEMKSKGVHKGVACESCHGPLAKHADDPGVGHAAKLDTTRPLRPLSSGQHRQAKELSRRSMPPTTPAARPAIAAISRTVRR